MRRGRQRRALAARGAPSARAAGDRHSRTLGGCWMLLSDGSGMHAHTQPSTHARPCSNARAHASTRAPASWLQPRRSALLLLWCGDATRASNLTDRHLSYSGCACCLRVRGWAVDVQGWRSADSSKRVHMRRCQSSAATCTCCPEGHQARGACQACRAGAAAARAPAQAEASGRMQRALWHRCGCRCGLLACTLCHAPGKAVETHVCVVEALRMAPRPWSP